MVQKCVWNAAHAVRAKDGYCEECGAFSGWEDKPSQTKLTGGKPPKAYPPSDKLLDDLVEIVLEDATIDPIPFHPSGELPDFSVVIPDHLEGRVRDQLRARIFKFVKDEFENKKPTGRS